MIILIYVKIIYVLDDCVKFRILFLFLELICEGKLYLLIKEICWLFYNGVVIWMLKMFRCFYSIFFLFGKLGFENIFLSGVLNVFNIVLVMYLFF